MTDDFNKIPDLINKMEKLNAQGETKVPFEELFDVMFMKKHTKFSDIYQFLESGNFDVDNFDDIPEDKLDIYIKSASDLASWQEFMDSASEDYVMKKLDLND